MRPIRRAALSIGLAGLFALQAAAGAGAQAVPTRSLSIPVTVEGGVQVAFAASAATGCGRPCDVSGSIAWQPSAEADLEVLQTGRGAQSDLGGALFFFGGLGQNGPTTTSHLIRRAADGSEAACSDARTADLLFLDFSDERASALRARLVRGRPDDSDLFRTRCGGPLESDLMQALPSAPIDRAALERPGTVVDLSGTRQFAAHGFGGTVTSSLRLRLGRAQPEAPLPTLSERSAARARALRTLTAVYEVERVAGSVETGFGGVWERSVCAPLDVCGGSGSLRISPLVSSGRATFVAYGRASRVSPRALRAALGLVAGPRGPGITASGSADWMRDAGSAAESYSYGDGTACADTVPLASGFMTFWVGPRRVFASYGRGAGGGLDPFRTRCPGPSLPDVAQGHPLATGNVSRRAFRKRRVVITLSHGRPFAAEPFRGDTRPALTIVLRRVRLRERIEPNPLGVFQRHA